jgi:hypothetical protein
MISFLMTALEIWTTGTATYPEEGGPFLQWIKVGLYQIAPQKD